MAATFGATRIIVVASPTPRATLTDGRAGETQQLGNGPRPGYFHVMDRDFRDYAPFRHLLTVNSDVLVRPRTSAHAEPSEERLLTAADPAAGVSRDEVVGAGWRNIRTPELSPPRLVELGVTLRGGGRAGTIRVFHRDTFSVPDATVR